MSGLVDRITAVQREHVSAQTENWETKLRCECGQGDFSSKLEYSRHVAERVAEALQLTEETRDFRKRGGPIEDRVWLRRWVSGWSAVAGIGEAP